VRVYKKVQNNTWNWITFLHRGERLLWGVVTQVHIMYPFVDRFSCCFWHFKILSISEFGARCRHNLCCSCRCCSRKFGIL